MGFVRFILAISVLIFHSSPIFGITLLPGPLAVQVFFIISGFYMTLIFTEKYAATSRPAYDFYVNRFLRLYPLYFVVILLVIVISILYGVFLGAYGKLEYYWLMYQDNPESLKSLLTIMLLNFTLVGQDIITFFDLGTDGKFHFLGLQKNETINYLLFNPAAWTIAVEIYFYLVTPFIVKREIKWIMIVIGFVLILRLILYVAFDVSSGFTIYKFAPTEFLWFLIGVLSYKLHKSKLFPGEKYAILLLSLWLLLMIAYPYVGDISWVIYVITFISTPAIFYRFSKSSVDRFLGDMSYPIYIGHFLLLMIVQANRFPKDLGKGTPLLLLTLLFSVLSHYLILKPIEKIRISRIKTSNPH